MRTAKHTRSARNKAAHAARVARERPDFAPRDLGPIDPLDEEPMAPERPALRPIPYNKVSLTEEQRLAVSVAILHHYPRNEIARALGVTVKTLKRLIDADPSLTDAADAAKDQEEAELRDCLMGMARNGSEVAALFLLKSRHGYVDRPDAKAKADGALSGVLVVPAAIGQEAFAEAVKRQQAQYRERLPDDPVARELRTCTDQGHGVVMHRTRRSDLPVKH